MARCLGGTFSHLYDPVTKHPVEELWGADWLQQLVQDMEATPLTEVLWSTQHYHQHSNKANSHHKKMAAILDFRSRFHNFWKALVHVTLQDNTTTLTNNDNDDDATASSPSSSRFRVEFLKNILERLAEWVSVQVVDLRSIVADATYAMAVAMLEHTRQLQLNLKVAQRQLKNAKRNNLHTKKKYYEQQIQSWERINQDLERIVIDTVLNGVFAYWYRDAEWTIRLSSMEALSSFVMTRPDLFFQSAQMKYFGWMLSDYNPSVRLASLQGLMKPLVSQGNNEELDIERMSKLIDRFQKRIVECVLDVDSTVAENAMSLILELVKYDMLQNLDDQSYTMVNNRALDPAGTPSLRKNALLFVLDQLEAFDDGPATSDSVAIVQLEKIVSWAAHALLEGSDNAPNENGDVSDNIDYSLVDLLVDSFRSIKEHANLMTNWSAMLNVLKTDQLIAPEDNRQHMVQQRVLLRVLIRAAYSEIRSLSEDGLPCADLDPVAFDLMKLDRNIVRSSKKSKSTSSQEEFTKEVLKSLPSLLESFKSESTMMQSLAFLPVFFGKFALVCACSLFTYFFHRLTNHSAKRFCVPKPKTRLPATRETSSICF